MKHVRLGMTESGLFLLDYVYRYTAVDGNTKQQVLNTIVKLVNWLYTTSGYYDKTVPGNNFNFDNRALNNNYFKFIQSMEDAVQNCDKTMFYFHEGFIMNLFIRFKNDFIKHRKINNFLLLNDSKFVDRIQSGFFDYMENKRVLVISSFDGLIKSQYESGNVFKVYENFPKITGLETVKFPYCFLNNGPHNNYFETVEAVFEEIKTKNFDLAILGCGSYGHMLCHKIHTELNKDAIYVGGCITNLFGILSSREKEHSNIKTNKYWITEIPDEYKPPNYKLIENGCYW